MKYTVLHIGIGHAPVLAPTYRGERNYSKAFPDGTVDRFELLEILSSLMPYIEAAIVEAPTNGGKAKIVIETQAVEYETD